MTDPRAGGAPREGQALDRRARLDRRLAEHRPADPAEARHLAAIRQLLAAPGDPFARDRYQPGHVTASAFVLSPARDRLLLILHRRLGRWLQPGGHVEPGDRDALAAARREVAEEAGLARLHPLGGLLDVDVHPIPARPHEPAHAHFDVRFALVSPTLELDPGSDAGDARWVPLDRVDEAGTDASVRRAVRSLRVRLAQ